MIRASKESDGGPLSLLSRAPRILECMKEDQMWIDIGPEKTAVIKSYGFDVDLFGNRFVNRGKSEPWCLGFEHVRDVSLATLRAELPAGPK